MKLVENWHRLHRAFSMQAMALAAAIQATWPSIPDDLKATLPHHLVNVVSVVLLVAGIIGRMVDQGGITKDQK
jgi:hypothetical protein